MNWQLKMMNWQFKRMNWQFKRMNWQFKRMNWPFKRMNWQLKRMNWQFKRVNWQLKLMNWQFKRMNWHLKMMNLHLKMMSWQTVQFFSWADWLIETLDCIRYSLIDCVVVRWCLNAVNSSQPGMMNTTNSRYFKSSKTIPFLQNIFSLQCGRFAEF